MARSRSLGLTWSPSTSTSGSSFGGLLALNYLRCTTIALIEADVAISIGPSGHLNVDAREDVIAVRVAGRGAKSVNEGRAKSSGFVFLGTVVGSGHESVTRAGIESNADGVVDVKGDGDVSVNAVSDVLNIHLAGSFAVGGDGASSFGVGAVVAVVLRTTEAFIGHLSDEEDEVGDEGSEKTFIRALTINARNDGGIYSFALAASVAAGTGKNATQPKQRRATSGELEMQATLDLPADEYLPAAHKDTVNREAGGFTAAGSMGLNFVEQSTRAGLNGGGTFRVSTVDISATDSTDTIMATGGAAISYQRKGADSGSNESDSKSLAGSISANFVYTAVQAFVRGVRLTSTATDGDGPEVAVRARPRRERVFLLHRACRGRVVEGQGVQRIRLVQLHRGCDARVHRRRGHHRERRCRGGVEEHRQALVHRRGSGRLAQHRRRCLRQLQPHRPRHARVDHGHGRRRPPDKPRSPRRPDAARGERERHIRCLRQCGCQCVFIGR